MEYVVHITLGKAKPIRDKEWFELLIRSSEGDDYIFNFDTTEECDEFVEKYIIVDPYDCRWINIDDNLKLVILIFETGYKKFGTSKSVHYKIEEPEEEDDDGCSCDEDDHYYCEQHMDRMNLN